MGFELKYYLCPKCDEFKLARNLDNGSFVCDNVEESCGHYIPGSENYQPYDEDDYEEPKQKTVGHPQTITIGNQSFQVKAAGCNCPTCNPQQHSSGNLFLDIQKCADQLLTSYFAGSNGWQCGKQIKEALAKWGFLRP